METTLNAPRPIRILLQTTIGATEDDWNINRFSLLRDYLAACTSADGQPLFDVTARNREQDSTGNDPLLSQLNRTDFDEVWLFAVDSGDGLTAQEAAALTAFWQAGGGLLITRDHQDLGSSVLSLGELGRFHFFHTKNPDPDPERCSPDDTFTSTISWPNYHSGSNGDYQEITPVEPLHTLLKKSGGEVIRYFPAHPHEGAVGLPAGQKNAQVIATGTSKISGRSFNLAVAFEQVGGTDKPGGRVVAESTFHHFVDYNWDINQGCPSFLTEAPGHQIAQDPTKLTDIKTYVRNLGLWLGGAKIE